MNTNIKKIVSTAAAGALLLGIMPLSVFAAAPITTNISPSFTTVGSAATTLTVNGSGFDPAAVVNFNGNAKITTYVSPNQLTASIPAVDFVSTGTFSVTVTNPGSGGGTSNAQSFTVIGINNPIPVLTSISPVSVLAGSGSFVMTVNGNNFNASSRVRFNGMVKTTTLISPTQLTAIIPASDLAITGQYVVDVFNTTPGGGTSGYMLFAVGPILTTPTLPDTGFGPVENPAVGLATIALLVAAGAILAARRVLSVK